MKRIFLTGGSGFFGSNLIDFYKGYDVEILNFDISKPLNHCDENLWIEGDILDAEALLSAMRSFRPDVVIHLAARTECDENTTVEEGYVVNTDGTKSLLNAIEQCDTIERVIITSSQFVCGPGRQPEGDDDYFPHTVYGESKVITEKLARAADLDCCWSIIRPVNVWGPYHERYSREFWKVASKGWYLHPDVPAPTRTYGYIGNVVWQINGILSAARESVDGEVFYVGDEPVRIDQWSIGFYRAFRGKEPLRLPILLLKFLAVIGDCISWVTRKPFLITSSRLKSMTVDYLSPITKTEHLLGVAPYSLDEGIRETVEWYNKDKDR